MTLRTLTTTNAFVVTDLPGAPASGIVRSAPKILQGGATDLARSLTYTFATFGMQRSGASAGINADDAGRDEAIAAFVTEVADDVASGALSFDAGKGVSEAAFAALSSTDDRNEARLAEHHGDRLATALAGIGPAVAAEAAIGLEGKTVAIEGFGDHCAALAEAVEARGAKVIAVSVGGGSVSNIDGFSAETLRAGWAAGSNTMLAGLGEPGAAWKVFTAGADVVFAGSKMGAVTHTSAENMEIAGLVPHQPIPFTPRALAILGRKGAMVVPDFIAVAGPIFASWPTGDTAPDSIIADASSAIAEAIADTKDHASGAFLGACARAEAFLSSWQDNLPFGRPLAS